VGVVYVASYVSEDLYGIVAGLSIGSLAIGFAAKDSIENLFGTMTVLLDKPYQLGDWITVGDIDGTVEEVGFRSTKIRTFYNSVISVPNSRFISAHIDNWGERRYRRIKTNVSIAYSTPPLKIEAFCEAIRELVRKHPYTRKDYYHIYLNQLGASSLDILVYCFVETPDWSTELREKHRLYLDILRVAEGLGVELAFPTQTLHLVKDPEASESAVPKPADSPRSAERMGRELADLIVKDGLVDFDGQKPPPVVID
jgi:MscS family membrane protein